jgi:hypothetical protein
MVSILLIPSPFTSSIHLLELAHLMWAAVADALLNPANFRLNSIFKQFLNRFQQQQL